MAVSPTFPGVYVEEFTPSAPIEGVGTSTAAFLGPSQQGPLNEPSRITSWDTFLRTFGEKPLDGFYLWYAVRGFFENGGQVCYVTRVSNASFDSRELIDRSAGGGKPTIVLTAREPGESSPQITVLVDGNIHAVASTSAKLFRPTAVISSANGITVNVTNPDDAAKFRPGDNLTWNGSTETKTVSVARIEGATIRLTQPLDANYLAGTVRLQDLKVDDKVFRVENAAKLGAGSVITLTQTKPAGTDMRIVQQVLTERISPVLTTYRVTLRTGLGVGFSLATASKDITVESHEFKVTVTHDGTDKTYDELGMDPEHPNYFFRVINQDTKGVISAKAVEPPNATLPPDNRPATDAAPVALTGGISDDPASLTPSDYSRALMLLEPIKDVNLVAIPDRSDMQVQLNLIDHCQRLFDRFAILDAQRGAPLFGTGSVELQRNGLDSDKGFAALYYPWLFVSPSVGNDPVLVPPSGHMAGIYARTDNRRGVHKAPAGNEALVRGALGIERTMSDVDQGVLNLKGINVVRVFNSGGRPVVWGARTTATDSNWQYVNIRRLFIFLEQSIEEGIRGAVFEPNNLQLWQKLRRTITEFLTRAWRDGALFGAKAEDAFYVRIDETLNPFSEQALGRLHIEIGVRPSYPAEFIIVRIGIWPGGSEVNEG